MEKIETPFLKVVTIKSGLSNFFPIEKERERKQCLKFVHLFLKIQ